MIIMTIIMIIPTLLGGSKPLSSFFHVTVGVGDPVIGTSILIGSPARTLISLPPSSLAKSIFGASEIMNSFSKQKHNLYYTNIHTNITQTSRTPGSKVKKWLRIVLTFKQTIFNNLLLKIVQLWTMNMLSIYQIICKQREMLIEDIYLLIIIMHHVTGWD